MNLSSSPGQMWLTVVRRCVISCLHWRLEAQFSQPNILVCLGKRKLMKAEDEGICVNSTHDFSFFPISALVTCLNTLITAPFINLTASAHVSFMSE